MNMRGSIQLKWDSFVIVSFFYSAASFLGFVLTSSGWTAIMFYGMIGLIVFAVNYFILFAVILIKKPDRLKISLTPLVFLFLVQITALLLNIGDYGDSQGSRSFFEVLFGRSYFACRGNDCSRPPLLGDMAAHISFAGVLLYLTVLVMVEVWILKGAFDQAKVLESKKD